jgi:hypothetical protein
MSIQTLHDSSMKRCQQFCISLIPTDLFIVSLAVRSRSKEKSTTPLYCFSVSLVLDVDDPLSRTSSASAASRIEVSAFCLKPSAATSRLLAISSSSDNNNRSLRECVIESKLVAARTYKGISFRSGHKGEVRNELVHHRLCSTLGLKRFLRDTKLVFIANLYTRTRWGCMNYFTLGQIRTDAMLTSSAIPSTRVSSSTSTFLFHSSYMDSRYSSDVCSIVDSSAALGRSSVADGSAAGRNASVWKLSLVRCCKGRCILSETIE